jgi:hypothetical protein
MTGALKGFFASIADIGQNGRHGSWCLNVQVQSSEGQVWNYARIVPSPIAESL